MAKACKDCDRSFATNQALAQHLRDSPAHTTFDCEDCDRAFNTESALQQHLRDSPAHAASFDCEDCNRAFDTESALQQHLRDSPAHAVTLDCEDCNRSFATEEALQQHLRDSPAHNVTFDCEDCDRAFDAESALQQHLRDSRAHATFVNDAATVDSYDMHPALHRDVLRLLRQHGLSFGFRAGDDADDVLKEYDTLIMGKFKCPKRSCSTNAWTSGHIAITIRQYSGLKYNARVYHQRCRSCNSLSRPVLNDSYAERVSYRLATWSGIALEKPPYSGSRQKPHESKLCEGCRHGRCGQSRL